MDDPLGLPAPLPPPGPQPAAQPPPGTGRGMTSVAISGPLGADAAHPMADGHLRRGAGLALCLVAGGMIAGGVLGGPAGAFAGLSFVGAARNISHATRDWKSDVREVRAEAGHAAVMAVVGLSIGSYLAYRAYTNHYGIKEHS